MDKKEITLLESDLLGDYEPIEQLYELILSREATFRNSPEAVDSMAYKIHNLYGAYEQLFETVAAFFENQIGGSRYHVDLLRRMKTEIKGVRPALISSSTCELLDKLRGFRHFFRHAYTAELDADKIDELVRIALKLKDPFRQDMEHFLEQLG